MPNPFNSCNRICFGLLCLSAIAVTVLIRENSEFKFKNTIIKSLIPRDEHLHRFHEYVNGRHRELGPIYREQIGPAECVFLSDPQMMREVFLHEGKYPRHPIPEAWLLYQQEHENKRGLLFMDGEEWLHHRKIMNHIFLRRTSNETSTTQPIETATQDLLARWQRQVAGGDAVVPHLEADMYKLSIESNNLLTYLLFSLTVI